MEVSLLLIIRAEVDLITSSSCLNGIEMFHVALILLLALLCRGWLLTLRLLEVLWCKQSHSLRYLDWEVEVLGLIRIERIESEVLRSLS